MSDESAILATVKTVKTLADGSVNIVLEIAPQHRKKSMQLLWESGTNVAVAPLTDSAVRKETQRAFQGDRQIDLEEAIEEAVRKDRQAPTEEETKKDRRPFTELSRSQKAGILCNEERFRHFLRENYDFVSSPIENAEDAASLVRFACNVKSRADLDKEEGSARQWDKLEAQYYAWDYGGR